MFDKNWFYRKDRTKVAIDLNTGLNTSKPVYIFDWETSNEDFAELLVRRFNEELEKTKVEIAKNAIDYLSDNSYELTKLKKKLKNWNSKTSKWEFK